MVSSLSSIFALFAVFTYYIFEQSKYNSQRKYSELFTSVQSINLTVTATNNSVSLQRYHSEYNISQKLPQNPIYK